MPVVVEQEQLRRADRRLDWPAVGVLNYLARGAGHRHRRRIVSTGAARTARRVRTAWWAAGVGRPRLAARPARGSAAPTAARRGGVFAARRGDAEMAASCRLVPLCRGQPACCSRSVARVIVSGGITARGPAGCAEMRLRLPGFCRMCDIALASPATNQFAGRGLWLTQFDASTAEDAACKSCSITSASAGRRQTRPVQHTRPCRRDSPWSTPHARGRALRRAEPRRRDGWTAAISRRRFHPSRRRVLRLCWTARGHRCSPSPSTSPTACSAARCCRTSSTTSRASAVPACSTPPTAARRCSTPASRGTCTAAGTTRRVTVPSTCRTCRTPTSGTRSRRRWSRGRCGDASLPQSKWLDERIVDEALRPTSSCACGRRVLLHHVFDRGAGRAPARDVLRDAEGHKSADYQAGFRQGSGMAMAALARGRCRATVGSLASIPRRRRARFRGSQRRVPRRPPEPDRRLLRAARRERTAHARATTGADAGRRARAMSTSRTNRLLVVRPRPRATLPRERRPARWR